MVKGKFNKKILELYLNSECDKHLFLDLGNERSEWTKPDQTIKKLIKVSN
ncbi:hypothetical protein LCGC14_1441860 [marine sediment metagenome]|uniref:Uncharacterized protein n=1 Tax=marine sediment metagenome TaxID=412755 RepID=A0A0F9JL45_9ZZZZ